ncbi:MAG TPA: LLM class F420-dependent oxidoreductase [Microthrixaceae bacterium]|nr:LLM class F420-dependent oxidoreductase [Microthrixaceae bacterium]
MQNPNIDIGTYGIWTATLDAQLSAAAADAVAELDDLGFGAVWIPETVFREPFVHAALLLAGSTRIKVATGIVNRYGRDPLACNAAMQTLNEAFPGRFLLGLGVSHEHLVSWLRKHDYSKPYSGMVEYLDAMDSARFFAPVGDPPAQMVLAALGPRMLRLAAERTAGALPYFVPPEHTAIARTTMGPEPLLAVEQMVVFDADPTTARDTARQHMAVYLKAPNYTNNLARLGFGPEDVADGGSDRLVDAVVAWGSVDSALTRVQAHLDAGADHVCIQVLDPDGSRMPMQEWNELSSALGLSA